MTTQNVNEINETIFTGNNLESIVTEAEGINDYSSVRFWTTDGKEIYPHDLKMVVCQDIDKKVVGMKALIKNALIHEVLMDQQEVHTTEEYIGESIEALFGTNEIIGECSKKGIKNYIEAIAREVEERGLKLQDINIEECEVCVECGTVMLPDDECYEKHDGEALCAKCSILCEDCEKYYIKGETSVIDDTTVCHSCRDKEGQLIGYPIHIVKDIMDDGSEGVLDTLSKAGHKINFKDDILACSTSASVVTAPKVLIIDAMSSIDAESLATFRKAYLVRKDIEDTYELMNDITVIVMKVLETDAESYFYDLSDFIQSVLIDNIIKECSVLCEGCEKYFSEEEGTRNTDEFFVCTKCLLKLNAKFTTEYSMTDGHQHIVSVVLYGGELFDGNFPENFEFTTEKDAQEFAEKVSKVTSADSRDVKALYTSTIECEPEVKMVKIPMRTTSSEARLVQLLDSDSTLMLANTNMSDEEIAQAIVEDDDSNEYEDSLQEHARSLNKTFERVYCDEVHV